MQRHVVQPQFAVPPRRRPAWVRWAALGAVALVLVYGVAGIGTIAR